MLEWHEKHAASGGVVGRDLKSALGRFGFVAGALPHVRPFLGPMYAWAAVLAPGTFAKFPDAVAVLLEYVMGEVKKTPMTRPRSVPEQSLELFRVDAKAEGDLVVVGGWETGGCEDTASSRWFSVTLTRKNAPWVFLKGAPFRNIASLELTAVLVATIVFGRDLSDFSSRPRIIVTGSTDNLGNMHVLRHFMSCKFPLSVVVMELAMWLKRFNMELDLGWIPRGQNVEADALTNLEFEGFSPALRIEVDFEKIEFLVLNTLMEKAGSLDDEIRLAKSSKEVKGDRPQKDVSKRKRGQTKWEDPW
eukprot:Skav214659  [mRNA]  locus=scaffold1706:67894:68805:- [translate_table: standard]